MRTAFIQDKIIPFASGGGIDLERAINAWWLGGDAIRVCQSPGLFMHSRLDRGPVGLRWSRTMAGALAKRPGIRRPGRKAISPAVGGPWRVDL